MEPIANWLFLLHFGIWFIDLDDTLMWNEVTYNRPTWDFIEYLTAVFHNRICSIGIIAELHEKINVSLRAEINPRTGTPYGCSCDSFPESLVRTYRILCDKGFGTFDEAVAKKCREIGRMAFAPENYTKLGLVPGAKETLDFLTRRHHMVLVTKGEGWVQENKINALNLKRWFHDIRVVDHKGMGVYYDILESLRAAAGKRKSQYTARNTVAVGNSFSSDIAPALDLGMNALFIPCPTWKAESVDTGNLTEDARSRLVELKEIGMIPQMVRQLQIASRS